MMVSPDEVTGGTVTYELGTSLHDTIELRDGTVVNGDLQYVDATTVVVQLGGNPQKFPRNEVKRILLIERAAMNQ